MACLTLPGSNVNLKRQKSAAAHKMERLMGSKGREIIGMDVDKLLDLLRRAYCDEWLAYHQYWLGAKLVKGPMKDGVGPSSCNIPWRS
jgi:hypothetical protein